MKNLTLIKIFKQRPLKLKKKKLKQNLTGKGIKI